MSYKGMSLPKGFKKRWIAALRSGKYHQAQSVLFGGHEPIGYDAHGNSKLGKGYCCLGVACHIQGIQNRDLRGEPLIDGRLATKAVKKGVPTIITGISAQVDEDQVMNPIVKKLVILNDTKKYSFEKIADWIEKYL